MSWVVGKPGVPGAAPAAWGVTRSAAAAAAGIGVVAGLARFGFTARGLVTSCLLGVLGALAVIDFREHVVPIRVVLPASAVLLALQLALFPDHALEWVLASVLAFGGLAALWLIKRDGIALTDATLGLLLGAGLGSDVAIAMFFGFLAIWPAAVYLLLRDGVEARKASVPLAPAFAIGAALVVFAT
jgi:leader peptidase (prepilin peptidase) / N-methyltransferase